MRPFGLTLRLGGTTDQGGRAKEKRLGRSAHMWRDSPFWSPRGSASRRLTGECTAFERPPRRRRANKGGGAGLYDGCTTRAPLPPQPTRLVPHWAGRKATQYGGLVRISHSTVAVCARDRRHLPLDSAPPQTTSLVKEPKRKKSQREKSKRCSFATQTVAEERQTGQRFHPG